MLAWKSAKCTSGGTGLTLGRKLNTVAFDLHPNQLARSSALASAVLEPTIRRYDAIYRWLLFLFLLHPNRLFRHVSHTTHYTFKNRASILTKKMDFINNYKLCLLYIFAFAPAPCDSIPFLWSGYDYIRRLQVRGIGVTSPVSIATRMLNGASFSVQSFNRSPLAPP